LTLNRLGRARERRAGAAHRGRRDLPPLLLEQIIRRTDGIPLFSEEVTKSVLESGIVREEHGRVRAGEPLPSWPSGRTLQASSGRETRPHGASAPRGADECRAGSRVQLPLVTRVCALTDAD
jgi:hypothetical protein